MTAVLCENHDSSAEKLYLRVFAQNDISTLLIFTRLVYDYYYRFEALAEIFTATDLS